MGNCWASIFRRRKVRRHIILLLLGLDNAGKTKTVNNLVGEKDDKVLPTVGFKAVNLIHKDIPVIIYDLGGAPDFRQIWQRYYTEVHGVIFVIDSSDYARLDECREVLEEVLSHDKISGKPVLVLANKQDKTGALDDIDVVEKLNIEPMVNRYRCPTLVESYTAQTEDAKSKKNKIDPGLRKGYQWLLNYIIRRYDDIHLRVQTDIRSELEYRRRIIANASNRPSQTFTTVSDDIITQTGFSNPNYQAPGSSKSAGNIIVVKSRSGNSGDSTMTVESVEGDSSNAKPKLSPLFGHSSSTATETVRVELEPRMEYRKLSPIVRNKVDNIDFKNKPQSSPTLKRIKVEPQSKNTSNQDVDIQTDAGGLNMYVGDGNRTWDAEKKHKAPVNDIEMSQLHREIVLAEREGNRTASSDIVVGAHTLPAPRPASASQLVRRQLEAGVQHKRRLSLRYVQRHKTSPERSTMLLYEPDMRRQLDKGDFERAATLN